MIPQADPPPVARVENLKHAYGKRVALNGVTLEIPAARVTGLIGPDGVGKSTLLSLVAGARRLQQGAIEVLNGDLRSGRHRQRICSSVAYMPQGLGRNLYATLTIQENIEFFGRLFGHSDEETSSRIRVLLARTGLNAFADRQAGKLSGGMRQKLALCCALVHDPDLLILDEPTTGVDPLSRRQFWDLIDDIRRDRPGISVLVATSYMEEAARFDKLAFLHGGGLLASASPAQILAKTGSSTLDEAFVSLLPAAKGAAGRTVERLPLAVETLDLAIEAEGLTKRFGDFTAVDHVSFQIRRGEIFGFLGSNGCGKSTTMKMLTGLLPADEGRARLFGTQAGADGLEVRRRVGYMSQAFSLYGELDVRENLVLHARLFGIEQAALEARVEDVAHRFDLLELMDAFPEVLPLGVRQRLSLAVAVIHSPEILVLDEPTSGVDPVAREQFWAELVALSRTDGVTVFISTHFMNEAERCDRISLMHAGRVLETGSPQSLCQRHGVHSLEEAFILRLQEEIGGSPDLPRSAAASGTERSIRTSSTQRRWFDHRRALTCSMRETLELSRDPIRATLAFIGSMILMFVIGYGINMDVKEITFAVLDRDQTVLSRDYVAAIAASRYFLERPALRDHADLDRRMREGGVKMTMEIPSGFAEDAARGRNVEIGAWIDGSMPQQAETARAYVQGMHQTSLERIRREGAGGSQPGLFSIETRFRYNPGIDSLVAMVPAVIPLLLLLIPSMLAALSVVREKELGSIVNLYVTPVTRLEFLLGKQLPYLVIAMTNAALLWIFAVLAFQVPFTGSLIAFVAASFFYVFFSTAFGLLISSFMSSQIAAIFGTTLMTIIPAVQFSGMIEPASSLQGPGALIGRIFPTTYFNIISRGTFSKELGLWDLGAEILPLVVAGPLVLLSSVILLNKQAR